MAVDKNNFNSGEISDRLWARTDLAQDANGIAEGRNGVPDIEGPLGKRGGFGLIGLPKFADSAARWVEYVRAIDDAYMIELGHNYSRVWGSDGAYLGVEDVSPFAAGDLDGLVYKQLGNVIVFFHADGRKPKRLQKVAENSWNWDDYLMVDGPWQAENTDITKTISASNWTGTVDLESSFALFDPGMVGVQFRLRSSRGLPGLKTWAADVLQVGYELKLSNGRVYQNAGGSSVIKSGNTPPDHDVGQKSDGVLVWQYIHDGAGVVQITAVTDATHATAVVIKNLPTRGQTITSAQQLITVPPTTVAFDETFAWAEGTFSDYRGWPTAWPELRGERLIVGGGRAAVDKYHATQTAGYFAGEASFTPGLGTGTVLDDDAISGFVGDDSFKVVAFASGAMLIALTQGGESVIVGETGEAALAPSTAQPRALSRHSAAAARPAKTQDSVLFIQRSRRAIRARTVSPYDYPGQSQDLSFLAQHIAKRRFVEIAYAGEPDYQLWVRLADGGLASFVFNQEQNIKGWTRQEIGGGFLVESINVLPDVEGNDRLWLVARRSKNSVAQRILLRAAIRDEPYRLDGFKIATGSDISQVTGLAAFEGENGLIMAGDGQGGYAQYSATVTGGVAALPDGVVADELVFGLPYLFRFESLPLGLEGRDGKPMKIDYADIEADMVTLRAGTAANSYRHTEDTRSYDAIAGMRPTHRVVNVSLADDHSPDPRLVIEDDSGFDLIIKAYSLKVRKGDA